MAVEEANKLFAEHYEVINDKSHFHARRTWGIGHLYGFNDLLQEARLVSWQALHKFDEKKASVPTYVSGAIRNRMADIVGHTLAQKRHPHAYVGKEDVKGIKCWKFQPVAVVLYDEAYWVERLASAKTKFGCYPGSEMEMDETSLIYTIDSTPSPGEVYQYKEDERIEKILRLMVLSRLTGRDALVFWGKVNPPDERCSNVQLAKTLHLTLNQLNYSLDKIKRVVNEVVMVDK